MACYQWSTTPSFLIYKEKVVQALEATHRRQSFMWRVIFATFTTIFSLFFLTSAYWQLVSPWDLKYHAYFMEELTSMSVVTADVAEAFIYVMMTWGFISSDKKHRRLIPLSFAGGVGVAMFWLHYMQRLSRIRWDLLWLPFGPCSCSAICMYVDHLILDTQRDVRNLRAAMYHFKRT
ncbi:hypothetical protein KP509_37G006200 [Ceratopteris richardii]|uniref:Uncharacterized protein n=1 Tax=Ceratopteris richardii TaxID=49495 RepID=A0A8T2Q5B7_CERRI|nr:hypothetical protein KP509_37G006200 [Ceratopteris richardii]